jgi:hypothetical protein
MGSPPRGPPEEPAIFGAAELAKIFKHSRLRKIL